VRALERKLLRDVRRLALQAVAIAVLVACAVAMFVGSVATWRALARSQARYYETHRFAQVFAEARRVPEPVRQRLAVLPGVATLETRAIGAATVTVPGSDEPATARVLSLPPGGARLNVPYVRAGRTLAPLDPQPAWFEWKPKAPGIVRVYCNIHPQMSAFVLVRDNPYWTRPAADGSFAIGDVPAGDWVIKAWHERSGEAAQPVSVGAEGAVEASLRLDGSRFKRAPHKNKFGKDYETGEKY